MGFDTDRETVYQIRPPHRNEEVRELIPGDYAGVMITLLAFVFQRTAAKRTLGRCVGIHVHCGFCVGASRRRNGPCPFSGPASSDC